MRMPIRLRSRWKFNNQPVWVDNMRFASKREAERYEELKVMQMAGAIYGLNADKKELRWDLSVNGVKICRYEADFLYYEHIGGIATGRVIEDAKGFKTPEYKIKKKLMLACHGIEIREV